MICVPAFALGSFVSSRSLRRDSLLSPELVHPHAVHLTVSSPFLASSLHAYRAINKSPSRANPANPLTDAPVLLPLHLIFWLMSMTRCAPGTSSFHYQHPSKGCWMLERSRDILPSLSTTLFSLFQPHTFAWAQTEFFVWARMGTDSMFLVNLKISGISKDRFQIFIKLTLETVD